MSSLAGLLRFVVPAAVGGPGATGPLTRMSRSLALILLIRSVSSQYLNMQECRDVGHIVVSHNYWANPYLQIFQYLGGIKLDAEEGRGISYG